MREVSLVVAQRRQFSVLIKKDEHVAPGFNPFTGESHLSN